LLKDKIAGDVQGHTLCVRQA